MPRQERPDFLDHAVLAILVLMLVLAPLALGAVAVWAQAVLFGTAVFALALWLAGCARRGEIHAARVPGARLLAAFVALVLFQMLPLPPSVLRLLSPAAFETYARALPGYPESGEWLSLALDPFEGRMALLRFGTLCIAFFLVINTVKTRRQALVLAVAVVAGAFFQVLYGFAEHFSGRRSIFWIERAFHLEAVTGTYHNRNHFAGLLEMAAPLALGLLVGLGGLGSSGRDRPGPERPWRMRIGMALASAKVYWQLVLLVVLLALTLGVVLSHSRGGMIGLSLALIGFVLCLALGAGFRKYTIVLLLLVVGLLAASTGIGMELAIRRVSRLYSGQDVSLADRADLIRSGFAHAATFPLLGSGFGSFGTVFPRFQSARFADRWADYLHNDWLQIFCETGVVGGTLLFAALAVLLFSTVRAVARRRDPFCKWLAAGALWGVGAMLVHSLFDYNLYKITSNGLTFAALLGLAFSCAHLPERRREGAGDPRRWRKWPISPLWMRLGAGCLAAGVVAAGGTAAARLALADIHLNRGLLARGLHPPYFFLPGGGGERLGVEERFRAASRMAPGNATARYWASVTSLDESEALVRERARQTAAELLGEEVERDDPEGFAGVVDILAANLRPALYDEREPALKRTRQYLEEAVRRAPANASYHLRLAEVLAQFPGEQPGALERAKTAAWLAPEKPAVLYGSGRLLLRHLDSFEDPGERSEAVTVAKAHLRQALFADPRYADQVYPLVSDSLPVPEPLKAVTPRTLRAYERLYRELAEARDWDAALACLEELDRLAEAQATRSTAADLDPDALAARVAVEREEQPEGPQFGAVGFDRRDPLSVRLSVAARRSKIFAFTGRWDERREAVEAYRRLLRESMDEHLEQARALRQQGRRQEAFQAYQWMLERDWSHPEALLDAADLASLPDVARTVVGFRGTPELLLRLVVHNDSLEPEQLQRLIGIVRRPHHPSERDEMIGAFVAGAGYSLAGEPLQALEYLAPLSRRTDELAKNWDQRHLIWLFKARALERLGRRADAVEAYWGVLEIVPTHLEALRGLHRMGEGTEDRLAELTPELYRPVAFGGDVRLLGYRLEPKPDDGGERVWEMTYYWEFLDATHPNYRPYVHFCDPAMRILFQDDHDIAAEEGLYRMDKARSGEVVVERRRLRRDPTRARYLRIGIYAPQQPPGLPQFLWSDAGDRRVQFGLDREALEAKAAVVGP